MSLFRGPNYSSERARMCRALGSHTWDESGSLCIVCGIRRDDFASPYTSHSVTRSAPTAGNAVGHMDPIMRTSR